MKKLLSIVLVLLATMAAMAQKSKTITITGKVSGDLKGYNYIYYYASGVDRDSAIIRDGLFTIELPFKETYTQIFYTQYELQTKRMYRPFPLLIDGPGKISIDMDIVKGFWGSEISGSKTAMLFNSFLKQQSDASKTINDEIVKLYGKGWLPEKDPLAEKLAASRDSLSKLLMGSLVNDFVQTNKDLFVGVYVLNSAGKSALDIDKLDITLRSLSLKLQKTPEGEKLAAYIRGVRNTKIGTTIKNFVLNDPNGKAVSFAQFKGKYVWIDFWASWCGPCKQAFPHMKELYAGYKDKGFEIIGISTDTKIEPWLKILPILNNPWPQLWDNTNLFSEFAVTAFPTGFLIDPDGKIVLKEIGFDPKNKGEMELKLEKLFGKLTGSTEGKQEKNEKSESLKMVPITPVKNGSN